MAIFSRRTGFGREQPVQHGEPSAVLSLLAGDRRAQVHARHELPGPEQDPSRGAGRLQRDQRGDEPRAVRGRDLPHPAH